MNVFTSVETQRLWAAEQGSLCARVRDGRLALGMLVGSWLGVPYRSWIGFEGDGVARV